MLIRRKIYACILPCIFLILLLLAVIPVPIFAEDPKNISRSDQGLKIKERYRIKLITGDTVNVFVTSNGKKFYSIEPADPTQINRHFVKVLIQNRTYIFPLDVNLKKVDKELFDIDYLVEEGYYNESFIPIIVSYTEGASVNVADLTASINSKFREGGKTVLDISRDIRMFHMMAMKIRKEISGSKIGAAFKELVNSPYVLKIWLDRKVHVSLDESVPLINADDVWAEGYKGEGLKIAILDTGIDKTHPSLDDLDDNPSTTDPKVIYEVSEVPDEDPTDYYGHGTHCAGIAAGTGGGTGYVGVAPQAYLMNVKVLDMYGWGYDSWIISGIEDAVDNGADVISMSLGGCATSDDDPLAQAVNEAVDNGVVVAVAAGNSGWDDTPFTIDSPGVAAKAITVGASDRSDDLAYFSSRGPTPEYNVKPDVLAPGVDITSSVPGGGWDSWSGTSMATPHVAGAAALLKQALESKLNDLGIGYDPEYMKDLIVSTAVDLGMDIYHQGSGRIDVYAAYNSKLLIHCSVLSFGVVELGSGVQTKTFTVYNIDSVDVTVDEVSLSFVDAATGTDYSSAVSIEWYDEYNNPITLPYTVSSGHYVYATLSIDTDSLPTTIFSGKLVLTDGFADYRVIFGISKLNSVIVHKIDRDGNDASDHMVLTVKANPSSESDLKYNSLGGWTDSSGEVEFHLSEGTYYFVSVNEYDDGSVYLTSFKASIVGNTIIDLDDGDAQPVTLTPNRDDVVIASREVSLTLDLTDSIGGYYSIISTLSFYPPQTHYLTDTDLYVKTYYQYYPERDMIPSEPRVIDTDTFYSVAFAEKGINTPKNYVVSESDLTYSNVSYHTAMVGREAAGYAEWAHPYDWWGEAWAWGFEMTVPTRRIEARRFADAEYSTDVWRYSDMDDTGNPSWEYWSGYWGSMPTVEHVMAYPLRTSIGGWWESDESRVHLSVDQYDSLYRYAYGDCDIGGGTINYIKRDGETLVLGDSFCTWYSFSIDEDGNPHQYEISTTWSSGHALSTEVDTLATLNFDPSNPDLEVPYINISFSPEPDLESTIPPGDVKVTLNALDWGSGVATVDLSYSLDDGATWNHVTLSHPSSDTWIGDLGNVASGKYISLRIIASDNLGNSISQDIIRAVYVGYPEVGSTLSEYPAPFVRDNVLDALMVVGATDKHGPFKWRGYTVDVIWGSLVTTKLGQYASGSISFDAMQDTDFASYDPSTGEVTIDWSKLKSSSVIAFGSPGVNLLALYYNDTLPFKFLKKTVYSEITDNYYVRTSTVRYGVIANIQDHGKNILLVWGLGGEGTRAVSLVLQNNELFKDLLKGKAVIIKWEDLNGNEYPDLSDSFTLVEYWPP